MNFGIHILRVPILVSYMFLKASTITANAFPLVTPLAAEATNSDPTTAESTAKDAVANAVGATADFSKYLFAVLVGIAVALVISVSILLAINLLSRRRPLISKAVRPARNPLRILLALIFIWYAVGWTVEKTEDGQIPGWYSRGGWFVTVAVVLTVSWLVARLLRGIEKAIVTYVKENGSLRAKRVETQMQIITRVAVVLVWVLGFAVVLLMFPAARAAGASILASAGFVSLVAGLAAQSTLSNVFAGLQLAFTDALRVDDLVVVDNQLATVEEITLTYVVTRIWDGRRVILPSTTFTAKSFENWTRRTPEIIGDVTLDIDWQAPIPLLRQEMEKALKSSDLWDGRTGVLLVSDAVAGYVQVKILVSAQSMPEQKDICNYLRERLVRWIQLEAPYAIPHNLIEHGSRTEFRVPAEARVPMEEPKKKDEHTSAHRSVTVKGVDSDADFSPSEISSTTILTTTAITRALQQSDLGADSTLEEDKNVNRGKENSEERNEEKVQVKPDVENSCGSNRNDVRTGKAGFETTAVGHESSLFTGNAENERRAAAFGGPSAEVLRERDKLGKKHEG